MYAKSSAYLRYTYVTILPDVAPRLHSGETVQHCESLRVTVTAGDLASFPPELLEDTLSDVLVSCCCACCPQEIHPAVRQLAKNAKVSLDADQTQARVKVDTASYARGRMGLSGALRIKIPLREFTAQCNSDVVLHLLH